MRKTTTPDLVACWEETALHTAVRLGDTDALGRASSLGADAHARDALGWTPLHLAAVLDSEDALGLLLSTGAAIDGLSHDGRTALGLAAAAGSPRAVRSLLASGATLSVPGEARAVLADASTGSSLEVVEALAGAGATTNEHVPYLVMALRLTGHHVHFGDKGYSRGMDEQPDTWFVDREMRLPWSLLAPIGRRPEAEEGRSAQAEWAEPRGTMVWDGFARFEVSGEALGTEAAAKADWWARQLKVDEDGFGGSPCPSLTLRSQRLGGVGVTEDLLMDVLDNRVAGLQLPRVVIALLRLAHLEPSRLEAKAPALARKMYARTITQGSPALLGALLAAGVSPNLRDDSGRTALMIAVGWGLGPAVETLLQHGADPALRDPQGRTASDIAVATGRSNLAQRLAVDG